MSKASPTMEPPPSPGEEPKPPEFLEFPTIGILKSLSIATAVNGLTFLVRFELPYTMVPVIGRVFADKQPIRLRWQVEEGGEDYDLGHVSTLRPSSLSLDPDGNPRFKATFMLPPGSVPACIGILSAGIWTNPVDGQAGRLTVLQEQGTANLA